MPVVYKLRVLKHFASWDTEWYFELYQVFMLNLFKYFDQKNQKNFIQKCFDTLRPKYDPGSKICSQGAKCFNNPNLYILNVFRKLLSWKKIERQKKTKLWTFIWTSHVWNKFNMDNAIFFLILRKYNSIRIQ